MPSLDELKRQRQAYRDFVSEFDSAVVVDGGTTLEQAIANISSAVLHHLSRHSEARPLRG